MRRLALTFLTTAALAAAPAAHAGSVSVFRPYCAPEQSKYGACHPDEARFAAKPGEVNVIMVSSKADPPSYVPTVTISDAGAPLEVGAGCARIDANSARCTGYSLTPSIDAGDGNDSVSGPGLLFGGAGNDTLTGSFTIDGGPGDDRIEGEDGSQRLQGGPGQDNILGAGGDDRLEPDSGQAGERDVLDGGEGTDTVAYSDREDGLTLSLQPGAANEDQLTAVENLEGGRGGDSLTGDGGANTLGGGAGKDDIAGGDGNDILDGGAGADRLDGGMGTDRLMDEDDKAANRLTCGPGADQAAPGASTTVGNDCEEIVAGELELVGRLFLRLPVRSTDQRILILRGASCLELPCKARMTAQGVAGIARGVTVAAVTRTQQRRRPALPGSLGLRLTERGSRLVRRTHGLLARVTVAFNDGGDLSRASFLVPLGRG